MKLCINQKFPLASKSYFQNFAYCLTTLSIIDSLTFLMCVYRMYRMTSLLKNSYCIWRGGAPKSLQMVTAAMKLKDACSLEEKL